MTGDDRATGGAASPNGAVHSNTSSDTFSSGFTQGRTSGPSPAPSGYAPAGPSHRTDANGGHEAPGTSSGSAGVLTVGRDVRNTQGGAAAPDYARHAQTKFATLRGDDDDDDEEEGGGRMATSEMRALYKEASAFEGVAVISMIEREVEEQPDKVEKALEITMEDGVTITVELDSGEKRLNDLGYKQELKRDMNLFQTYCLAVTTITVFAGVVPTYGQGFMNGGPVALVWYWWITVFFTHLVGLSFSEIASSLPMAGSLYFWAAALAPPRLAPAASFFTGWLEFFGPMCGLSSVACNGAFVVHALIYMCNGYVLTKDQVYGMASATVIVAGLLNLLPIAILAHVFVASALFQLLSALVLIIMLPLVSPLHQPASFVFGTFYSPLDITNTPSQAYAFVLALLVSQFSLYGYDGVCHLAEETKRSDKTGPVAIMGSITTLSIVGWLLIVSATFCIQSPTTFVTGPNTNGYAFLQILWDSFYSRFGNGVGAQVFTFAIWTSFFFGCLVGMAAAVRVSFSLARDNGFPLSRIWRVVNPRTHVPAYAVGLVTILGLLFLLPLLGSTAIFNGITSAQSIAWVGAYSVPIFFRLTQQEEDFCPGPFYMADYIGVMGGKMVHLIAFLWVLYCVAAFNLPYAFPVTSQNFNWAPVALAMCLLLLLLWWLLDARHWFRGPRMGPLVSQPGLGAVEGEAQLSPRTHEP